MMFGRENLHIMPDGDDWETDDDLSGVNLHVVADAPREGFRGSILPPDGSPGLPTICWQTALIWFSAPIWRLTPAKESACPSFRAGLSRRQ